MGRYCTRDVRDLRTVFQYLKMQCYGSWIFFIPDPVSQFFHPRSRVKIFRIPDPDPGSGYAKCFNHKNCFQVLGKIICDVHSESRIRVWIFLPPVSWIQVSKSIGSRIRIRNSDFMLRTGTGMLHAKIYN
jgi:hypothetical protein